MYMELMQECIQSDIAYKLLSQKFKTPTKLKQFNETKSCKAKCPSRNNGNKLTQSDTKIIN